MTLPPPDDHNSLYGSDLWYPLGTLAEGAVVATAEGTVDIEGFKSLSPSQAFAFANAVTAAATTAANRSG